mgnify:CR=1 FL=1
MRFRIKSGMTKSSINTINKLIQSCHTELVEVLQDDIKN